MIEDNSLFYPKLHNSLEQLKDNLPFNTNIESINIDYDYDYGLNHYFCTKCHKFPFIKFCKDRKNVRFTCSCFNNKKTLIKELFKIFSIDDSLSLAFTKTNSNIDIENELICKEHKKNLKAFQNFI